ncbi:uncharacterized protein LOC143889214 [Tasmannia lanceolata]|uniref:uncharacterized protein LOC143889214 n=1 Tax=Tasmannia lanceolata TaxID=3420 RepID=UPI004062BDFC
MFAYHGDSTLLLSFPCSFTTHSTSSWPRNPVNPRIEREHLIRCSSRRTGPYRDSNADTVRTGRFRFRDETLDEEDEGFRGREKRNWWSDDSTELDEDSDLFDQQPWDNIWFFKVLKPYGWMLPAIIISMLLTTGPKAFLMALALPLGQSALSLAFDKLWGKARGGPKPKAKTRRKPFARASSDIEWEMGEEEENSESKGMPGYQSWVATDNGVVEKGEKGVDQRRPSFGGWDELDRRGAAAKGPTRRAPRTVGGQKKGKLTRRGRNRDVPLLLRLLIAVFPFLGSWTKIF